MNTNPLFMTKEDRDEVRELLADILSGHNERMEGRYNVIHENLVQIKEQTTRTNGRVNVIEGEIEELKQSDSTHYKNCPIVPRLNELEKSEISRKAIFRFAGGLWIATIGLIGVLITLYEVVF